MRDYELAFIIQPSFDEEGATGVIDEISQQLQNLGGQVAATDVWGRKTLAYPIKDYREGTYVLLNAKLPPASVLELERYLKLKDSVIRYLLINSEN